MPSAGVVWAGDVVQGWVGGCGWYRWVKDLVRGIERTPPRDIPGEPPNSELCLNVPCSYSVKRYV